VIGNHQLELKH